jgi:hypothetical protein
MRRESNITFERQAGYADKELVCAVVHVVVTLANAVCMLLTCCKMCIVMRILQTVHHVLHAAS